MRDCIFLLADKNMEAVFTGFLERERFYNSLQCQQFGFDANQDVIVDAGGNDPGIYNRAHELLRPYLDKYRYAVVVLDEAWEGSPGADAIKAHISENLRRNGWSDERFTVCVILPELENWIWQDSIHVANAFAFESYTELKTWLIEQGMYIEGEAKPQEPKEAIERVLRLRRIPRSSAIYKKITGVVSVRNCTDEAFLELCEVLCRWFPQQYGWQQGGDN